MKFEPFPWLLSLMGPPGQDLCWVVAPVAGMLFRQCVQGNFAGALVVAMEAGSGPIEGWLLLSSPLPTAPLRIVSRSHHMAIFLDRGSSPEKKGRRGGPD